MDLLPRTTQRQLLTVLEGLAVLNTQAGRDQLLQDLPDVLVGTLRRSDARTLDLAEMVHQCSNWKPRNGTLYANPLHLLVQNALHLAEGSQTASSLRALLEAFPAELNATPPGRCPYPGMVPFSPADARFFYGREAEIARMRRACRPNRFCWWWVFRAAANRRW